MKWFRCLFFCYAEWLTFITCRQVRSQNHKLLIFLGIYLTTECKYKVLRKSRSWIKSKFYPNTDQCFINAYIYYTKQKNMLIITYLSWATRGCYCIWKHKSNNPWPSERVGVWLMLCKPQRTWLDPGLTCVFLCGGWFFF